MVCLLPATTNKDESDVPLYEYKCDGCEHLFERIQNFRSRAPKCPECGGRTKRQLSAPAIQFKGTGWYLTDYARKDKGGDKKESAEKGKTASDGGSAKTESSKEPKATTSKPKKKSGDS